MLILMDKLFRQTGIAEILTYLLDNSNVIQKDLMTDLQMNNQTVMRAAYQLQLHDLVVTTKGNFNSTIYKLTEKGKQVALLFRQINEILIIA